MDSPPRSISENDRSGSSLNLDSSSVQVYRSSLLALPTVSNKKDLILREVISPPIVSTEEAIDLRVKHHATGTQALKSYKKSGQEKIIDVARGISNQLALNKHANPLPPSPQVEANPFESSLGPKALDFLSRHRDMLLAQKRLRDAQR